jgi:hypothetical protein
VNGFRLMQRLRAQGVTSAVAIEQALLICAEVPTIAHRLAALGPSTKTALLGAGLTPSIPQPVRYRVATASGYRWAWADQPAPIWIAPPPAPPVEGICRHCDGTFVIDSGHRNVCPACRSAINSHAHQLRAAAK